MLSSCGEAHRAPASPRPRAPNSASRVPPVPELPDILAYIDALGTHVVGRRLERVRVLSPFVLRTVDPPVHAVEGRVVGGARRLGKRIVLELGDELFVVLHLMIAGRLRWAPAAASAGEHGRAGRARRQRAGAASGDARETPARPRPPGISPKMLLAFFDFAHGTLFFTEAGSKKRASMQVIRGEDALRALDSGGLDPLDATPEAFRAALTRERHTLKRALTDPRLFSGIGNAYSDEILHAARLSPLALTRSLTGEEIGRLQRAAEQTLRLWIDRLRPAAGEFPDKVTAFHGDMAVHGRFGRPCPVCGAPIQRIVYADRECNYCARCQTGGRLLADRALSRLLREDWPRSIDEA